MLVKGATGQNACHVTDNIFKGIFMNEKFCILIGISLKFVHKGPILAQFTDAYTWH